jgi:Carboxypeptidase regulatory-like domain
VWLGAAYAQQLPPRDNRPPAPTAPAPRTGSIVGRVTDESGQPLRHARVSTNLSVGVGLAGRSVQMNDDGSRVVTLLPPPPPPPRVENEAPPVAFTDNDGRFALTNLDPGRYTISVRKAGYVPTTYGARHAGEPPIGVDVEGGGTAGINVRLARSAGISGRIVDQFGEPVEGALVTAERPMRVEGRITTRPAGTATTDDLGEYRIGGLPASRYVISAYVNRMSEGMVFFNADADGVMLPELMSRVPGMSQVRTYYPGGVGLGQAQPVEVRTGEERASADFAVGSDAGFPLVTLSFFDADGKAVPGDAIYANTATDLPRFLPVMARNPKLAFRVEPGTWSVLARGNGTVGMTEITAASGDIAANVVLGKGGRLTGRVETDGAPLPTMRLSLTATHAADPAAVSRWSNGASTRADGTFEIDQLLGPLQLRVVSPPRGWALKSVVHDGRDITDAAIDFRPTTVMNGVRVVMTNRVATLEGIATDSQGAPLVDYSVLVFPADRALAAKARRYARWARPNQQGRFAVDDLLAGDYLAVATTDVDDTQWQNADYLERFRAQATKLTLGESEKKTVTLQLVLQ